MVVVICRRRLGYKSYFKDEMLLLHAMFFTYTNTKAIVFT